MADGRRELGAAGEDLAAAWYVERGYAVVARNWRCRAGELDLVLRRGGTLVFSEVKARRSVRTGAPAEAVTAVKQRRIRGLALQWLAEAGPAARARELRFDVVSVLGAQVEVVERAF